MRIQECSNCHSGYYVILYHERNRNISTKIGANCKCERSTIDSLWIDELVNEYRCPASVDNSVLPFSYLD